MDLEERLRLIKLPPIEEIVTEEELIELLRTKEKIVAYDGFEPSGLMHLGTGILRAIKLKDFLDAKIDFIIYIADWFAYLNNKFGGNIELIRKAGEYFIEGWKACGVDISKIKIVWCSDLVKDVEYWETFMKISKTVTIKRALRAVTVAGREESDVKSPSLIIYPLMQATDVLMLNDKKGVDICELGMDQRKVNMLVREIVEEFGRKKPVAIHHHLLRGLQTDVKMGSFDENETINKEISLKMSKSKPETCIFIHDTREDIERKIMNAFCPPKDVENNPVVEIVKYIIFRKFDSFTVKRKEKYGGNLEFKSYEEFEKSYKNGEIHPMDLKVSVIEYLDEILRPVREHFEKNKKARELYEIVRDATITR
ncbi:MAG: tyrosine--tRNA ligase [Candidatus Aenigmarchaeota archaeon]|nr:tyrosine--tRNA ligase [Candidatus Aenigmarchaeota archaeon]MDW7998392.1 tyrosine--tRNA ligase [Thermodesulfovibrio sp.]MDW8160389.1 tyrosine--tRNA ligase [Candidatus Aenigmarchaeota archaeon]